MDHIETFKSPDKNNFIFKPENLIGCLTTTNQVQIETRFKIKVRVSRYPMFHMSPIGKILDLSIGLNILRQFSKT